jgi:hypothetical protein
MKYFYKINLIFIELEHCILERFAMMLIKLYSLPAAGNTLSLRNIS